MTEFNNEILQMVDKYNSSPKPLIKEYAPQKDIDFFSNKNAQDLRTICCDYQDWEKFDNHQFNHLYKDINEDNTVTQYYTTFDDNKDGSVDFIDYSKEEKNKTTILDDTNGDSDGSNKADIEKIIFYDENSETTFLKIDEDKDGKHDYSVFRYKDKIENTEIENTDFEFDGKIDNVIYNKYDEHGNLIYNLCDYDVDGKVDSISAFEYDENNQKTKLYYDEDGDKNIDKIISYEYENGEISNTNVEFVIDIDGKIDDFSQGKIGDCWLLAGIKAMSLNQNTAQILKNAITDNKDGSWTVSFDGIFKQIKEDSNNDEDSKEIQFMLEESVITLEELNEARNLNKYSQGDDDVLLFELAFEKVFDKIKSNPDSYFDYIQSIVDSQEDELLSGGRFEYIAAVFGDSCISNINYLRKNAFFDLDAKFNLKQETPDDNEKNLTLIEMPEFLVNKEENGLDFRLPDFHSDVFSVFENNKNQAVVVSFNDNCLNDDLYAYDINNERVALSGHDKGHAWVLVDVSDDKVTLINPWNTKKEYVFNRDEILDYVREVEYYIDE